MRIKVFLSALCALATFSVFSLAANVETETQLRNAANDTTTEEVTITKDITFSTSAPVTINKEFTITGTENTEVVPDPTVEDPDPVYFGLNGNDAAQLLNITTDKSVTITDTSLTKGYSATTGGAVNVRFTATNVQDDAFLIENVSFTENNSGTLGGAVYIEVTGTPSEGDTFTIKESSFNKNTATGDGGAIYANSALDMTIEDSTFTENIAATGGALSYTGAGKLTLTNLTFDTNETTTNDGGAVTLNITSEVTADNITFTENKAATNGGAMQISSSSVETAFKGSNLIFSENTAGTNGGAIYNDAISEITNATFAENKTTAGSGGAVYNAAQDLTFKGSNTFSENTAGTNGGAIFTEGKLIFDSGAKTVFSDNEATGDGGAVYVDTSGEATFKGNTTFSDNTAAQGGAIALATGATATVQGGASFTDNSATGNGGAVYMGNGSTLNLISTSGINFSGNTNAVYMTDNAKLNLNGSNIITFSDTIEGSSSSAAININATTAQESTVLAGAGTSVRVNFNGDMSAFLGDINVYGGTLGLSKDTDLAKLNLKAGTVTLDLIGKTINDINISTFTSDTTGTYNLKIDVDLENATSDTITGASGDFNISDISIIKDAAAGATPTVNIGSGLNLTVNGNKTYWGPLFGYKASASGSSLDFTSTGEYNPVVLTTSIANNATVFNNMLAANSLLNRLPLTTDKKKLTEYKTWFVPYGGSQEFDFEDGLEGVDNISYGASAGVDFPAYAWGDNFIFVPSVFAGYSGSKQKYKGAETLRDSGLMGIMGVAFNDYFLTAVELHVANGRALARMDNKSDSLDIFSFTAAAKAEFDIPLGALSLQPGVVAAYNLVNSQNYTSTWGAKIDSSKLTNLKIVPQARLTMQIKTWKPFISAGYYFNAVNDMDVTANDAVLPEYGAEDYFEYGIGLENTFIETYSFFVHLNGYAQNVSGFSLQAGFRGYF